MLSSLQLLSKISPERVSLGTLSAHPSPITAYIIFLKEQE